MTRPSIILTVSSNNIGEVFIDQALLYVNGKKPQILSNEKVCEVINQFDGSIYKQINNNQLVIDNPSIIKKFLSKNVNRNKKLAGLAIASAALIVGLTITARTGISTDADALDSNLSNELNHEEEIAYETPAISEEGIIDLDNIILNESNLLKSEINVSNAAREIAASFPTFEYSYEDRSSTDKIMYTKENYQEYIARYSKTYGLDENLVTAIIAQENAYNLRNDSNSGARGVSQIESIWWGENVTAFNYDINDYETVTIDGSILNDDPEYAIKIGCMILNNYYNEIFTKCTEEQLLTPDECLIASLTAYNKGNTAAMRIIRQYGNDYINHRDELRGGDNLYTEHVLSYLEDQTLITFKNKDLTTTSVYISNAENKSLQK